MAILGIVLLLAAGAVTVGVVTGNAADAVNVSVFGNPVGGLTVAGLFVAGVVTGLVALLALVLLVRGFGRSWHRRRDQRRTAMDRRRREEELRKENERLERELEEERTRHAAAPARDIVPARTAAHAGAAPRGGPGGSGTADSGTARSMTDGSATGGAMPSTPTGATATEEKKAAHPADQVPEDSTTHARAGRAGEATGTIHG